MLPCPANELSKNMSKVNMAIPICVYMYRNYISYTLTCKITL